MKEVTIYGTSGVVAKSKVDDELYEEVNKYRWNLCTAGYPNTKVYKANKRTSIMMHQVVLQLCGKPIPRGYETDHYDRDKLNNQIYNLQVVTRSVNQANKGISKSNKSGLKCVCRITRGNKRLWRFCAKREGKVVICKMFPYTDEGKLAAGLYSNKWFRENHSKVQIPNPQLVEQE